MKPTEHTWLIRLYFLGGFLAVAWLAFGLFNQLNQHLLNSYYIELGQAVDCPNRPHWETLQRCDSRVEGIACTYESQTRLMHFVGSIDYVCAQHEPEQTFRFPYNPPEGVEVAEVTEP